MQPTLTPADLERFWAKVEKTSSCWLWTGTKNTDGYGRAYIRQGSQPKYRGYMAHRLSFVLAGGEIPDRYVLDHICRVRNCVNPEHLRAVTNKFNILAGISASAVNARRTHCKNGHEFTPENTRISRGARICRTCDCAKQRRAKSARVDCPDCGKTLSRGFLPEHRKAMHAARIGGE